MNFLEGQVRRENGEMCVYVGRFGLTPIPEMVEALSAYDGKPIVAGIRAENMEALLQPAPDSLQVKVLVVEPLGSQNLLTIRIENNTIKVSTHPDFRVVPDQDIWIRFPGDKIRWYDREMGRAIVPDLEKLMAQ